MNYSIPDRLKEIKQLQNIFEINELDYKAKTGKNYNFSKIQLTIEFLRNMHIGI